MEMYFDIIKKIADVKLEQFLQNGHADAGSNGPYGNHDTPVRNTAHWLVTYTYLWRVTKRSAYREVAEAFLAYLLCQERYGPSGAIQCMWDDRFDRINGLIGQAFVMEGFAYAAAYLDAKEALTAGKRVFFAQHMDEVSGLWSRVELDGTRLGIDHVFNHQLWFAAAGSLIGAALDDPNMLSVVGQFLARLDNHFVLYSDGLIRHFVPSAPQMAITVKRQMKTAVKRMANTFQGLHPRLDLYRYENSYHLFCLYGFALMKQGNGQAVILKSEKIAKAVDYAADAAFIAKLDSKSAHGKQADWVAYSYGYNAPAFAYPYVASTFGVYDEQVATALWSRQAALTYERQSLSFSRNTTDPVTLTARLYELVRYLDAQQADKRI